VEEPQPYQPPCRYKMETLPAWNSQAVHLSGSARRLDKEELAPDLTSLLEKHEHHRENPVLWDTLSPSLLEKEMKGIVGFKIKVNEIQAAYKMSQNRNEADYRNIVEQLQQEENPVSSQLADEMNKRR